MIEVKKKNPYSRSGLIQIRVNKDEAAKIFKKAKTHFKGSVSSWVRYAAQNHDPKKGGGDV